MQETIKSNQLELQFKGKIDNLATRILNLESNRKADHLMKQENPRQITVKARRDPLAGSTLGSLKLRQSISLRNSSNSSGSKDQSKVRNMAWQLRPNLKRTKSLAPEVVSSIHHRAQNAEKHITLEKGPNEQSSNLSQTSRRPVVPRIRADRSIRKFMKAKSL